MRTVQVKISHEHLQLVFTHEGKRHYVSLGLSNTPLNRKLAQDKAFQTQRDIEYGKFDPTYEKYTVQSALTTAKLVSALPVSLPQLPEFWEKYTEARKTGKSPATIRIYGWVANHLDRCPYKLPSESQKIFDWVSTNIPANSAKRILMHISAFCKWF